MSYAIKKDGTPVLAVCYWSNGLVASYVRRTLAVAYLHQFTEPATPAPSTKKKH